MKPRCECLEGGALFDMALVLLQLGLPTKLEFGREVVRT